MINQHVADSIDSPTPGFSFGMRLGCVRDDHGLSLSAMAKSVGVAPVNYNEVLKRKAEDIHNQILGLSPEEAAALDRFLKSLGKKKKK